MAAYFGASDMQSDGLQTLYLMNPGYPGYSTDHPATPAPASNMIFLNSAGNHLSQANLPQMTIHGPEPSRPPPNYNLWTSISPAAFAAAAAASRSGQAADDGMAAHLGLAQQGLSLSLSPQQPAYRVYRQEAEMLAPEISPGGGNDVRMSGSSSSASGVSGGMPGLQSVLMGSKYLRAAQELLDEVACVGNGIKEEESKGKKGQMEGSRDSTLMEESGGAEISSKRAADLTAAERQELQIKKGKLISMLEEVEQRYRQYHHQMQVVVSSFEAAAGVGSAKTYTALALKTISKQFRCLRDAIMGQVRAASRGLGEEDGVGGRGKGEGSSSSSRLRLLEQHLRQQRALQQLSVVQQQQHNAWRPQRGLPERAVSVLRSWLFEHFLHPYPKDSDKLMLAKQTGLTRNQVSNWFINARVRLWKPMIEEMYVEETKDQEQNGSCDKTSKSNTNEDSASKSIFNQETSPVSNEHTNNMNSSPLNISDAIPKVHQLSNLPSPTTSSIGNSQPQACFSLMGSPYMAASCHDAGGMAQGNQKKARTAELQNSNGIAPAGAELRSIDMNSDKELYMKYGSGERSNADEYSLIAGASGHEGAFGGYQIGDLGRFDADQFAPRFSGGGVSLSLGLPHCENLSLSRAQQTYLSNHSMPLGDDADQFCAINAPPAAAHPAGAYERIDIQSRKRFATQLLPDFVA